MQINQLPTIPQAPANADVFAIEVGGVTYKIPKSTLASAILGTIDPAPTQSSANLVKSGGVYNAIAQATASVSSISFSSETTWSQIYAKLKTALNDQNRAIALITVYSGAVSSVLTANNYGGYLKGYVTLSGGDNNLYDFFAGALSTGDMFAWRVTASDSAPTISNFRRYVDSESIKTEFPVSYVNIGAVDMLARIAQMSSDTMLYFRTTGTTTNQPASGLYMIGTAVKAGQNILVQCSEMLNPGLIYQNSTNNNGSSWVGWKKFTGTAV